MIYCKRFEDGTGCIIQTPENICRAEIDFLLERGRGEILKMKKAEILKKAFLAVLVIPAAAVSVFLP